MHVFIIILTILCRLKIAELKKRQIGDIGFINTNLIDAYMVEFQARDTEAKLLQSFVLNQKKSYNTLSLQLQVSVTVLCVFDFPYILVKVIVM